VVLKGSLGESAGRRSLLVTLGTMAMLLIPRPFSGMVKEIVLTVPHFGQIVLDDLLNNEDKC
jgi:hypothetical protein